MPVALHFPPCFSGWITSLPIRAIWSRRLQSRRQTPLGIPQWLPSTIHPYSWSGFKSFYSTGTPVTPPWGSTQLAPMKSKSSTPTSWCSAYIARFLRLCCRTRPCLTCTNHRTMWPFLKSSSGKQALVCSPCREGGKFHGLESSVWTVFIDSIQGRVLGFWRQSLPVRFPSLVPTDLADMTLNKTLSAINRFEDTTC